MPLEILAPLVVIGIAGIALALHLLGLTAPLKLESDEAVARAWLREFPEDAPRETLVSQDGRNALLRSSSGKLGLLRSMGADTVAHDLSGAVCESTPKGLCFSTEDFATPRFHIHLSETERDAWAAFGGIK